MLVEDEEPALPFLQEKTLKGVTEVSAHKDGVTMQDIPLQSSSMMQSFPPALSQHGNAHQIRALIWLERAFLCVPACLQPRAKTG